MLGATAFGPKLSDDEIQGAIFDIDGSHLPQSLLLSTSPIAPSCPPTIAPPWNCI